MKTIFTITCLFILTISYSQSSFFSQSAELLIPEGALKSSARIGFATNFKYEVGFSQAIHGLASIGFCTFGRKSYNATSQPISSLEIRTQMVPMQLGVKAFPFHHNINFSSYYVGTETGVHLLTGKITLNGQDVTPPNEIDFSYALLIGIHKNRGDVSYKQQFIAKDGKQSAYAAIRFAWQLWGRSRQ